MLSGRWGSGGIDPASCLLFCYARLCAFILPSYPNVVVGSAAGDNVKDDDAANCDDVAYRCWWMMMVMIMVMITMLMMMLIMMLISLIMMMMPVALRFTTLLLLRMLYLHVHMLTSSFQASPQIKNEQINRPTSFILLAPDYTHTPLSPSETRPPQLATALISQEQ